MKKKQILISAIVILVLAFFANTIWLYEILYRFGWLSLDWLAYQLWSIYVINLFVIIAYLLPFFLSKQANVSKLLMVGFLLYGVAFTYFMLDFIYILLNI